MTLTSSSTLLSPALTAIDPPAIALVNEEADRLVREGRSVIRLGQAVPDLLPPPLVLDRVKEALSERFIHFYSPDPGLFSLRERISEKLRRFNGIPCDPERELLVTTGANHAFFQAMVALYAPDGEVILPSPCYMNHAMAIRMLGMRLVEVPMREDETGYHLDPEAIASAITPRTRAIVVVSPNNPTGAIFSPDEIRRVADLALEREVFLISDEVYEYFSPEHFSIASEPRYRERVMTLGSFSKTFGMTGWRVGYMHAPAAITEQLLKVQDTIVICAPTLSQVAVEAALRQPLDFLDCYNAELRKRAEFLRSRLSRIPGISWRHPQGAMFGMAKIESSSTELSLELLRQTGVATVPGAAFGRYGEHHLRISFGFADEAVLADACDRMADYFARLV